MPLHDKIFPQGPPRDGMIVRTRYVGSWESQFRGLGRLTAFLSEYLLRFNAAVDDIALNVVYLQRHRVEVGLKLILERASGEIPTHHDIADLARRCSAALRRDGHGELADRFAGETREFVDLIHRSDSKSFAYRYPVDTENQPAKREEYVDLQEFEAAGARFQDSVIRVVNALTESENVPVADKEVEATTQEVAATLRAIRSTVAFTEQSFAELTANTDRLARLTGRQPQQSAQTVQARAAADAQLEVLTALEPQLEVLLRRLEPRRRASPPPLDLGPRAVDPLPQIEPGLPKVVNERLDQLITAYARGVGDCLVELKRSLVVLGARVSGWPSPADQQLHADLSRFASRLMQGVDPLNQPEETTPAEPSK